MNEPRANGSATLSAFGLVRGPNVGAVMISNGGPRSSRARRAPRVVVVGFQNEFHVELFGSDNPVLWRKRHKRPDGDLTNSPHGRNQNRNDAAPEAG